MHEYKVLQADTLISAEQLNELGEEGWELVTIIKDATGTFYFYLRRLGHTH